jgi:hypothetical protein
MGIKTKPTAFNSFMIKSIVSLYSEFLNIKKGKNTVKLLNVLKAMPHRFGPDEFFSLPGRKSSVCYFIYSCAASVSYFLFY